MCVCAHVHMRVGADRKAELLHGASLSSLALSQAFALDLLLAFGTFFRFVSWRHPTPDSHQESPSPSDGLLLDFRSHPHYRHHRRLHQQLCRLALISERASSSSLHSFFLLHPNFLLLGRHVMGLGFNLSSLVREISDIGERHHNNSSPIDN